MKLLSLVFNQTIYSVNHKKKPKRPLVPNRQFRLLLPEI